MGGFHHPERFGDIVFGRDSPSLKALNIGEEKNTLIAKIANKGKEVRKIEVRINLLSLLSQDILTNAKIITLKPGEEKQIDIPYQLKKDGKQVLLFSLLDAATNKICYQSTYPLLTTGTMYYPSTYPFTAEMKAKEVSPRILAQTKEYLIWLEGSTRKVFKDDIVKLSPPDNNIHIYAAKGEYEPFQIVITPKKLTEVKTIRLEFSDLRADNNHKILKDNIIYNPIGYVNIEAPTDAFSHLGLWPDLLLEEKEVQLDRDENYPVWITVHIPRETFPGKYKGTIELLSNDSIVSEINLNITVWDFALPVKPYLHTLLGGLSWGNLKKYYPCKGAPHLPTTGYEIKKKYRDNAFEHRATPYNGQGFDINGLIHQTRGLDGSLIYDFSNFDEEIEYRLQKGATGFCIYGFQHWRNRPLPSLEKLQEIEDYLRAIGNHCEDKGWLEQVNFYIRGIDEPTDHAMCQKDILFAKLVKRAHPKLKYCEALDHKFCLNPKLYGYIDIWVSLPCYVYDKKKVKERQALGEEVWWYTACNPRYPYPNFFTDHPAINYRILFWMMWKYKVQGYLCAGITHWPTDPYKSVWAYDANGAHCWLYPGKNGPINTIRWELAREGIEDYDYLSILKERVGKLRKLNIKKYDRFIKESAGLLDIDDALIKNLTEYTKDPDKIYEARRKIGETIETINRLLAISE